MGRLEKQIIAGALALVGLLLVVVIYRGLDRPELPSGGTTAGKLTPSSAWEDPGDGLSSRVLAVSEPVSPPAPPAAEVPAASPESTPATATVAQPPAPIAADPPAATAGETTAPSVRLLRPEENWDVGLRVYEVRDGDTLGHIAQRELGSYRFVDEILKLNEGVDPKALRAGQKLHLPTHVRSSEPPAVVDAAAIPAGARMHEVAVGDTLWELAERYLGSGDQFRRILVANPGLSETGVLKIGSRVVIPAQ